MMAKKQSPKYAILEVHTKEILLMLNAIEKMEQSTITRHFGKELEKMRETLKLLSDEMVM